MVLTITLKLINKGNSWRELPSSAWYFFSYFKMFACFVHFHSVKKCPVKSSTHIPIKLEYKKRTYKDTDKLKENI